MTDAEKHMAREIYDDVIRGMSNMTAHLGGDVRKHPVASAAVGLLGYAVTRKAPR